MLKNKYLGELCPHGHDHKGWGKSLRWINGNHCYECKKIATRKSMAKKWHTDPEYRKRESEKRKTPEYKEQAKINRKNRRARGKTTQQVDINTFCNFVLEHLQSLDDKNDLYVVKNFLLKVIRNMDDLNFIDPI